MGEVPQIPEGKKIVEKTDASGNKEYVVRHDPNYGGCYAVTATYGHRSRELAAVRRKCKYIFLMNPFLILGWCVYKFYGPFFVAWSKDSSIGAYFTRRWLADPIVAAASDSFAKSIPALVYLFVLSIPAIALLVPIFLLTQIRRVTNR